MSMGTKLREYGFESVGAFVNGIFYMVRFNESSGNNQIKTFLEDVLDGNTILDDDVYQELQTRKRIREAYYETLEDIPGLFVDITNSNINRFLKNERWMEAVTEMVEDKTGIAIFPKDAKSMVKKWYQYMLDSGKGRKLYTEWKKNKKESEKHADSN